VSAEDQVVALFGKANPVPTLDLLDPIEPVTIDSLTDQPERGREMRELKVRDSDGVTMDRTRSRGPLVAAGVAVVVILVGIVVFASRRMPDLATPVGRATAFWEAVSVDDREGAISYLDPEQVESGVVNLFGRAHTIEGQFEWYEAVGFRWDLEKCIETAQESIECTVTGRNDWSDAIGIDPVRGTYFMEFGENGITNIIEQRESFVRQWLPDVFDTFSRWVSTYHPEDAPIMWNDSELTQEGLELFRINTARFVEAYPSE
jgi:hypothetical protein